ncbi:delta 1-pyrroline-5-carboxylate dehydrogenase domain protein [Photobacterium aphoticum]|uniref:Delta 1-pyrroline-5-carboxylate dehydrogenase domain protein n=1 Tax=Photobacterium aphoticum TaxID=754436 RepID=A0A090RA56_9GAMM|nr:delta 1-pyrroline-5-carboxylate dehydrogenase domain protein [Photobacterium aphoticum]
MTGNTVVLCLPEESEVQAQTVESALTHSGCNAISAVPESMIDTLLAHPAIAGVAYAGNMAALQRLARQVAAREGALAAVIGETDVHALPVVGIRRTCCGLSPSVHGRSTSRPLAAMPPCLSWAAANRSKTSTRRDWRLARSAMNFNLWGIRTAVWILACATARRRPLIHLEAITTTLPAKYRGTE